MTSTYNFDLFKKRLDLFLEKIEDLGGNIDPLTIGKPATEEEIKAVEAEMEEKIKKEKGKDADLVYTGYNKANLLADAEKGKSADKASDTKKDSSSQTTWIVIGVLVVLVAGFFGYKQFNKKKEEE